MGWLVIILNCRNKGPFGLFPVFDLFLTQILPDLFLLILQQRQQGIQVADRMLDARDHRIVTILLNGGVDEREIYDGFLDDLDPPGQESDPARAEKIVEARRAVEEAVTGQGKFFYFFSRKTDGIAGIIVDD